MEIVIIIIISAVILFVLFRIFKAFIKLVVILLIVIAVVAYFTNPEESAHRQRLKEVTRELPIKKIKDKAVEVDDYKIFSITKVNVGERKKIVGIGAFGKVWYVDKVEEKLKKQR